jgi:cytochrome P450
MGLVLKELPIALATMLQRFEIEPGSGSLKPVRDGISFRPANSVRIRVRRRPSFR